MIFTGISKCFLIYVTMLFAFKLWAWLGEISLVYGFYRVFYLTL